MPCGYLDVGIDISVKQQASASDRVVHKLLLPKLRSKEEEQAILKEALKKRGFQEGEDGKLIRKKDDLEQIVDLEELTITTIVEKGKEVEKKSRVSLATPEKKAEGEASLRQSLEKDIEKTEAKLQEEVQKILKKTDAARQAELDDVIRDVYTEGLKKRAADKGTVQSITEGKNKDGNFEMRIKGKIDFKLRNPQKIYRRNPDFEIIFIENAVTRKKDIYIHVERDADELTSEHKKKLREIAKQLIGEGLIAAAEAGEVIIKEVSKIPGQGHGHEHGPGTHTHPPKKKSPPGSTPGRTGPIATRKRNPELSAANKSRWVEMGRKTLESITELPESLKQLIRESLDTPQYGPYHNEGLKMETHLGLMMENIAAIADGSFDFHALGLGPESEKIVKETITAAIQANLDNMKIYAYLHDLEKPNCMALKLADKSQKILSLKEWKQVLESHNYDEAAVLEYLKGLGAKSITYRHEEGLTGGAAKDHGPEGGKTIRQLAKIDPGIAAFIPGRELILTGIENHEMHFQVFSGSRSAKQYYQNLVELFKPEEISFIYAVCLIDIASSLGPDGNPDYSGFRNMVEAHICYQLVQDFAEQQKAQGKPLKSDDYNSLMNAQGFKAVQERIAKLSAAPAKKSLGQAEIDKILAKWSELGISEDLHSAFEEALHEENYAAKLASLGLAKVMGKIKNILKR